MSDQEDNDVIVDDPIPQDEVVDESSSSEESEDDEGETIIDVVEEGGAGEVASAPSRLIPRDLRTTMPRLTRFEMARIVGIRAQLIDEGSPLLIVAPPGVSDPVQLALLELRARKSPVIVRRVFCDGSYEEWLISEMVVIE